MAGTHADAREYAGLTHTHVRHLRITHTHTNGTKNVRDKRLVGGEDGVEVGEGEKFAGKQEALPPRQALTCVAT